MEYVLIILLWSPGSAATVIDGFNSPKSCGAARETAAAHIGYHGVAFCIERAPRK